MIKLNNQSTDCPDLTERDYYPKMPVDENKPIDIKETTKSAALEYKRVQCMQKNKNKLGYPYYSNNLGAAVH